ncbi:Mitotic spindle checkpoint component mad3 like protein [Verticillium longisporum]|nr:Mitotic spindle checkpoint component mad3 like protein [Verticillium longisporum]
MIRGFRPRVALLAAVAILFSLILVLLVLQDRETGYLYALVPPGPQCHSAALVRRARRVPGGGARGPHLRGLHGTFIESISMSTTHELLPLFAESKLPQNNAMLVPGANVYDVAAQRAGRLGAWLRSFADVAFTDILCDPPDMYTHWWKGTLRKKICTMVEPYYGATPQSQLHTLLERATKAFITSAQYKNDPRYLKLWILFIQFFADAPRETFLFISRHNIGESLALFYEEYAAWLEGAGRWAQAEEVYKLGIERGARPEQRLMRKFNEFEQRQAAQGPEATGAPSSPALPAMRPALAAKVDPYAAAAAAAAAAENPQAPQPGQGVGGQTAKPGKAKMSIFSDASAEPSALSARPASSEGWDTIDSLANRKKENVMQAKPWVGETMKAGGKKSSAPKMQIFKDTD